MARLSPRGMMKESEDSRTLRWCTLIAYFRGHVDEHASEPVICDRGEQIRRNAELRAGKRCRHGIAAKGNCIFAGHLLLIAARQIIRDERDVNIGLADEQGFQDRKTPLPPPQAGNHPSMSGPGIRPAPIDERVCAMIATRKPQKPANCTILSLTGRTLPASSEQIWPETAHTRTPPVANPAVIRHRFPLGGDAADTPRERARIHTGIVENPKGVILAQPEESDAITEIIAGEPLHPQERVGKGACHRRMRVTQTAARIDRRLAVIREGREISAVSVFRQARPSAQGAHVGSTLPGGRKTQH